MTERIFRVGNCAGFSGDRVDAPGPVVDTLVESGGPSAIFFEVLGERTVALAQLEKRRDPSKGYEPMLERLIEPILARCVAHGVAIVGNFGGANPRGAAGCVARVACRLGLPDVRIAVVEGDDIRDRIRLDELSVYEADASLDPRRDKVIAANVYLGAEPMVAALAGGAQVVVTGRTGDPALALAPLAHHFGWRPDDWGSLAVGTTAGHLLECGAQVTGGVYYDPGYKDIPDPANIGFPIAEVSDGGRLIVAKAARTGGLVNLQTVKEQLLYEIHDPAEYLTPDVVLDFSEVRLAQVGPDRVEVAGMRGRPRPELLKAVVSFEGGWLGEGEISLAGPNCLARARLGADVLRQRLDRRRLPVRDFRIDIIGVASVHDDDSGTLWRRYDGPEPSDVRLRLAVSADDHETADQAVREVLAFLCCGPAGSCGARWRTTPRIKTQSYLVPRESVSPSVKVLRAEELVR